MATLRQDEAYRQANAGGSVTVWLSLNHSAEQRVEHRKPECHGDERMPVPDVAPLSVLAPPVHASAVWRFVRHGACLAVRMPKTGVVPFSRELVRHQTGGG